MQLIRRILEDVRATRAVDKEADDEAIIRANPQLMPELREWLLRLRDEPTVLGPNPQAPAAGPKGTRQRLQIPGYSLIQEIGRGGQAVVFLALQLNTGRKVAVKVVSQGSLADDRALARMKREAQVLASLNHPNIVTILDTGVTSSGARYIVMNYIEGSTLDEFMSDRDEHADDPSELLRLFIKIATAIHAAHAHGIIHRDLKPSNIRIDERGEPQILDFGLARTSLDRLLQGSKRPVSITGEFLGSLPWCSPEQARGNPDLIDARTDVYSLGVILYQMITGGRFPYEVAGNIADVLNNIISAEPTPPSQIRDQTRTGRRATARNARPPINRTIEAIVLKALEKSPERRYQTADQLANAITRYLAGQPSVETSIPGGRMYHSRNPSTRAAGIKPLQFVREWWGVLGVAAMVLLSLYLLPSGPRPSLFMTDAQRLVGKWQRQNPISNNLFIEFFPDGAFVEDTALGTLKGAYRFLPNNRIEVVQQGMLWGSNSAILQYKYEDADLLLTVEAPGGMAITSRCKKVR